MPDYSDREIVEKALAGDMQAFKQLVERHQSFVYRLAYRLVRTTGDAEDVTQETFIRLWKNLNRYRADSKLTTWLYKIVTNLCLDLLKSRHSRQSKQMIDLDSYRNTTGAGSADESMMNEELLVALEKLTGTLSEKQKTVFVLRDLEGLSMQETCDVLSMSPGNVKSNLFHARKKLGDLLERYYQQKKPVKP